MEVLCPHVLGIELISGAPPVAAVPPHEDEVMVNPAIVPTGLVDG